MTVDGSGIKPQEIVSITTWSSSESGGKSMKIRSLSGMGNHGRAKLSTIIWTACCLNSRVSVRQVRLADQWFVSAIEALLIGSSSSDLSPHQLKVKTAKTPSAPSPIVSRFFRVILLAGLTKLGRCWALVARRWFNKRLAPSN